MRELGVGDLAVPKRMRKVGEAYLGRLQSYVDAIGNEDAGALPAALARNIWEPDDPVSPSTGSMAGPGSEALATYARAAALQLAAGSYEDLCAGRLKFPEPR